MREAALDVKELLRAEIGAEARLGDAVIRELQSELGRSHAVAAVGDIRGRRAWRRAYPQGSAPDWA